MMHKINTDSVREQARGQWPCILTNLGIPRETLTNKHQPCPCCGGRDRFRFDDKQGNGSFICTHWANGAGDGFALVQHWLNCGFTEALQAVAGVLGLSDTQVILKQESCIKFNTSAKTPVKDQLKILTSIWNKSHVVKQSDAVAAYLVSRGLDYERIKDFSADALRFTHDMAYWIADDNKPHCLGQYPCMLGNITNDNNELMGLHLTYLEQGDDGTVNKLSLLHHAESLPAKKMRSRYAGSLKGGSIKLYKHDGRLAVCEGIETALAVREASGLPVWACLSAYGLQTFTLPEGLNELFIYADNDSHKRNTGFHAAHNLAIRAIKAGIKAHLWQSEQSGFDALDVLNQVKGQL